MGTKKGGARKGKPKGSRLAYDDTEAIKSDRELKPVKTRVRKKPDKRHGGIRQVPKSEFSDELFVFKHSKDERIDEAVLRLIQVHHKSDNIIQAIERLILGKYK